MRIGNWDYYRYDVTADQAHRNKLAVEFYSSTPHAWPIALVRRNDAPRLKDGLVPTVDAFVYTEVDGEGFELIQGQRMSIIVNETTLSEGAWYIGVYNLWGHNGVNGMTSKETLQYSLTATLYNGGARPAQPQKMAASATATRATSTRVHVIVLQIGCGGTARSRRRRYWATARPRLQVP